MDAPFLGRPTLADGSTAIDSAEVIATEPSNARPQLIAKRKIKKKKETVVSDSASLDSSNNSSSAASCSRKSIKISRESKRIRVGPLKGGRKNVGLRDVDALGLPLGMSIAAVVAQVLERKNVDGDKMSVDYLSEVCGQAVRESLGNVFGDKFDNFVMNFETSFRSTLMTLHLISRSSENDGERLQRARFTSNMTSCNSLNYSTCPPETTERGLCTHINITEQHQRDGYQDIISQASTPSSHYRIGDSARLSRNIDDPNLTSQQLVLHDKRREQQLDCASPSNQITMLSTIEKSVMEQTRSNDLKTFEIGLIMKKLELKEREFKLNCNANMLERWKLSMGISKASFRAEKFKTQLQDTRQVELLKNCLDFLVAGLLIMLSSLAYGTYVYSHQRIVEATEACSPYTESKSWWMPKPMSSINSTLQLLKCQIQVLSRMLFSSLMIGAIALLLVQRSAASSHQTMPLTFILLILGVCCGYAGKLCIDTLGGSGYCWLMYWEALCLLHFFCNVFHSTLFTILNGPILVAGTVNQSPVFPYWMRKSLFFATLLVLPLLCGFMPFADPFDWFRHFLTIADDSDLLQE